MRASFYDDPRYKEKQSSITRELWLAGRYKSLPQPLKTRRCKNPECSKYFRVKPYSPNIFCTHRCSAVVSNLGRRHSLHTRQKISLALWGRRNPNKFKQRVSLRCSNSACNKTFEVLPYLAKTRKYCTAHCAISFIGRQTTSPKAAKSKPGIRPDIDSSICFYSTWEANVARVFNLVGLRWEYAPKIFDLGEHTYRPDFYLPDENLYIEVKNFMGKYSLERDKLFREKYPKVKLEILARAEYEKIELDYSPLVEYWER